MRFIKPSPLGILTRPFRFEGGEHLGIAVPVMSTLGDAPRLVSEKELWDIVGEALNGYMLDAALPKHYAEFLLSANAYGKYCDESNTCPVSVSFCGIEKHLLVSGDRRWRDDVPASAQPFDTLALDWRLAFGGHGCQENPLGTGAEAPEAPVKGLPNIEYEASRVSKRGDRAEPAGFGPIAGDWPQRRVLYGALDQQWLEVDRPGFPRTMDKRYFNVAPADQQFIFLDALPDCGAYRLVNMHPRHAMLEGTLPPLRVRAFVQRLGDDALEEVALRLTTAWFIPHRERVVMIFHGRVRMREFDTSDIGCLMLGAERCNESRPVDEYRRVFDRRSDRERGALHALRDSDLVPETLYDAAPLASDAHVSSPFKDNMLRRAREEASKVSSCPLDPAIFAEPASSVVSPGKLADFVEKQLADAKAEQASAEALRRELEQTAQKQAVSPISLQRSAPRGPPVAMGSFLPPSVANAAVPPELGFDIDEKLRESYLQAVQYQEAAPCLDAIASRELRSRVAAMAARGESLEGMDLTGADLSGMNLRHARLSRALLECADLSGADLSHATLEGAVLARARLAHTTLSGANLTRANLSLAACEAADFDDAKLDQCILERARFANCRMRGVSLKRAQFKACEFDCVDMRHASLGDLTFLGQTLNDVIFAASTIRKTVFVDCTLNRVSFAHCDIEGLGFLETRAEGIDFADSRLCKACFVRKTVLDHADFSNARLSEVNLGGACLHGTRFRRASIDRSDFTGALLEGADFRSARIHGTRFARADLSGADFTGSDLLGASMRRAVLNGACFDRANLFRADLSEVAMQDTRFDDAYLEQTLFHPKREANA
ncbi:DUF2169 family type VI secretion system accessory protein [Caballeronia ptereochthonis]|uniref:Pentapeptide repeat-containing protein n=1 Tax=Caballeronia ptereochthonis TaxID=1777144 RepID=A0A158A8T7_9BURK|nr:DUF2169 domain-containing protein [Caballeronia ptereochthonis]SAK54231.1 pentapeptide repeat-containing protein [Caballeronia ptereochthonis]